VLVGHDPSPASRTSSARHPLPQRERVPEFASCSEFRLPSLACETASPALSLRPDAAVAQLVEQRIRNSVAAVSSYSVLSQQVLNCLQNWAKHPTLFWSIPCSAAELGSKMVAMSSSFVPSKNLTALA
jgi:hypothetical protein